MWIKGLLIWFGAAAIGAVGGSLVSGAVFGEAFSRGDLLSWMAVTAVFTLLGSMLLTVAYAWLGRLGGSPLVGQALLVALGAGVGGFVNLLLFPERVMAAAGAVYGCVTALAWVGLLRLTRMDVEQPSRG